jgi:hypothetical protein
MGTLPYNRNQGHAGTVSGANTHRCSLAGVALQEGAPFPGASRAGFRAGLPGSSTNLSTRAVPNHPGKSDGCVLPLLSPSMAGFIQIRRTGHFHWRNEAESGSRALRLMCSPCKASPTRITPRQRSLGSFDERVISKISSFQLIRLARLRLAHPIARIREPHRRSVNAVP